MYRGFDDVWHASFIGGALDLQRLELPKGPPPSFYEHWAQLHKALPDGTQVTTGLHREIYRRVYATDEWDALACHAVYVICPASVAA